jgi:hypothetical protein
MHRTLFVVQYIKLNWIEPKSNLIGSMKLVSIHGEEEKKQENGRRAKLLRWKY